MNIRTEWMLEPIQSHIDLLLHLHWKYRFTDRRSTSKKATAKLPRRSIY